MQEFFFLPMLRYLFLESQNRRQCWTARTIIKQKGSAKLPWSVRLEWPKSPMAVSKGVRGVSRTTFGHRCSQAPRTSPQFIAGLMERGLGLILIWGFLWTFVKFLSFPIRPLKQKYIFLLKRDFFRTRYSADINKHLYGSIEDCESNGLDEVIKCLQYEKWAYKKQKRIRWTVWL